MITDKLVAAGLEPPAARAIRMATLSLSIHGGAAGLHVL